MQSDRDRLLDEAEVPEDRSATARAPAAARSGLARRARDLQPPAAGVRLVEICVRRPALPPGPSSAGTPFRAARTGRHASGGGMSDGRGARDRAAAGSRASELLRRRADGLEDRHLLRR